VCSAVRKERDSNSCATCISHTISHGTTQPSIHLRLGQEIRAERVHLQKRVLVVPLCLIQLWTVFGLASNAAHKNQRAERVMSCSYHKQLSPQILRKRLIMKPYKLQLVQALKPEDLAVRAGLSSRHLPCDSRSTYRVSVSCVQNFESFSIDWCRCEVLRTPNLFSV
jgi:hypothetical protein